MFWTQKHQIKSSNHEGFFKNFPCCRQFFARILQSADKFCRIFPCKMSEFSMFYKLFGCMHACILHVLSVRLTREHYKKVLERD